MTLECPHCHVRSHFTIPWSDTRYHDMHDDEGYEVYIATCDSCGMPVCGVALPGGDEDERAVWPLVVARVEFPDVPEPIARAASEAHQALAASAPLATVAMARATIEATAKNKGITSGGIQAKIERLATDGHISDAMKEVAHEIRLAGNEAAHSDIVNEPISVQDAAEIVGLMDAILERVYQEPAKVARVRASREARKKGSGPAGTAPQPPSGEPSQP